METWCVNLHVRLLFGRRGGWSWFYDGLLPCLQAYQSDVCFCLFLSIIWYTTPCWYQFPANDFSCFNAWSKAVSSPHSNTPRSLKPKHQAQISVPPETRLLFSETTSRKCKRHFNRQKSSLTHWADAMCPGLENPFKALCSHMLWFESQICLSLAVWVWTVYLIFLSLTFLIWKTGVIIKPAHQDFLKIQWNNAQEALRTARGAL